MLDGRKECVKNICWKNTQFFKKDYIAAKLKHLESESKIKKSRV